MPDSSLSQQIQTAPTAAPAEMDAGRSRSRLTGGSSGALAGVPLGALAAAVVCWLADYGDYAWQAAACRAAAGVVGGAALGFLERALRGAFVRPDVATVIGVAFGAVVALIVLLGNAGFAKGRASAYLLVGAVFAAPAGGLIVGGLLDRAFEAAALCRRRAALGLGAVAVAVCLGAVVVIAEYSDPSPQTVAARVREIATEKWQEDPETSKAKVRNVTLYRPLHRTYRGEMVATLNGEETRFDVEVYVRHNRVEASWVPRE
jgi:hypothetical protein